VPKVIELWNNHVDVEKGRDIDREASQKNGQPVYVDAWTIVYTDRVTGDQIRCRVQKETRDIIVKKLTGGIILAGGDLPSV
jgi:hypothetical protein